jgi:hypothetical protein
VNGIAAVGGLQRDDDQNTHGGEEKPIAPL